MEGIAMYADYEMNSVLSVCLSVCVSLSLRVCVSVFEWVGCLVLLPV